MPQITEHPIIATGGSVFSSQNRQLKRDLLTNFDAAARRSAARAEKLHSRGQNYAYHPANSPLCRTICITVSVLAASVALCLSTAVASVFTCGLGSAAHRVALRNETSLLPSGGLTTVGTYGPDVVSLYVQKSTVPVLLQSYRDGAVPAVLVLNATRGDSKMTALTVTASRADGVSDLRIHQTDRRGAELNAPFFNSGWFLGAPAAF